MADYSELLEGGYQRLKTKTLSRAFCTFVDELTSIASANTPENQKATQELFLDMNSQIDRYNEQFQVILDELGVLCKETSKPNDIENFFEALLDLFRLAFSVYQTQPDKLDKFHPLLQNIVLVMDTQKPNLKQEDPLKQALLLQLAKSAWALSNARNSMEITAKALKEKQKQKTRKQKRT